MGATLDGACLNGADLSCAQLTWANLSGCSLQDTLFSTLISTKGRSLRQRTGDDGAGPICTACCSGFRARAAGGLGPVESGSQSRARSCRSRALPALKRSLADAAPAWCQRPQQKYEELEKAKVRVPTDEDLRELLQQFSRDTGKPLNLRGCNLAGVDLRGAELSRACLSCADLSGAVLAGAVLKEPTCANLAGGCRPQWCAADGAKLSDAGLPRANLRGASLRGAKLAYGDLSGADTEDAHFDDADLLGATGTGRPGDPVPPPRSSLRQRHRACSA